MGIKISQPNRSVSNAEIEEFEASVGTRLPDDYRAFLLNSNGGEPEANEAQVPPPTNGVAIRHFYGILGGREDGSLMHVRDVFIDRVPLGILPIADDNCGNLVCLSLRPDNFGCVFFWDHELEADEDEPATFANLFKIGNSFRELFESLKTPAPILLKEGQVKSVWIDSDFLANLKKKQ